MADEPQARAVGLVGLYDDVNTLIAAAEKVRDAGYRKWDCHTPYPVHGLDQAMGLRPSVVPMITILAGFVGVAAGLMLTYGLSVIQYPIRIGGKALFSWQAFVPIYFELFVLFASLATMGGVIFFCGLMRWRSPLHDTGVMEDVTCDRFAIVLDASDEGYREEDARTLLRSTGCEDIRPLIEFEEKDDAII